MISTVTSTATAPVTPSWKKKRLSTFSAEVEACSGNRRRSANMVSGSSNQYPVLSTQYPVLSIQYSVPRIRYSVLSTQYSSCLRGRDPGLLPCPPPFPAPHHQ